MCVHAHGDSGSDQYVVDVVQATAADGSGGGHDHGVVTVRLGVDVVQVCVGDEHRVQVRAAEPSAHPPAVRGSQQEAAVEAERLVDVVEAGRSEPVGRVAGTLPCGNRPDVQLNSADAGGDLEADLAVLQACR